MTYARQTQDALLAKRRKPTFLESEQRMQALLNVLGDRDDLKAVALSTTTSQHDKLKILRPFLDQQLGFVVSEADRTKSELAVAMVRRDCLEAAVKAAEWALLPQHKLEMNDCSRLHKLVEAAGSAHVLRWDGVPYDYERGILDGASVFVIRHDWAAVVNIEDAKDGDDSIPLPAPVSVFEFRISDRTVVVMAHEASWTSLVEIGDYWVVPEEGAVCPPGFEYAYRQMLAASVVLDAEVATHEVKRAPEALNKKRAAAGKLPLYDFHVIDLSRKKGKAAPPLGGYNETGKHKRLHFCRGHWRHYPDHKTWIRWCLKGDPDLGFVDKEYRV